MSHQLARPAFGGDSVGSLVDDLDAQVRDPVRREGVDPQHEVALVRHLAEDVVRAHDDRSLTGVVAPVAGASGSRAPSSVGCVVSGACVAALPPRPRGWEDSGVKGDPAAAERHARPPRRGQALRVPGSRPRLVVAGSVTCVEPGMPGEIAVITWWMPEGANLVCNATNVEARPLSDGLVEYQASTFADVAELCRPAPYDPPAGGLDPPEQRRSLTLTPRRTRRISPDECSAPKQDPSATRRGSWG